MLSQSLNKTFWRWLDDCIEMHKNNPTQRLGCGVSISKTVELAKIPWKMSLFSTASCTASYEQNAPDKSEYICKFQLISELEMIKTQINVEWRQLFHARGYIKGPVKSTQWIKYLMKWKLNSCIIFRTIWLILFDFWVHPHVKWENIRRSVDIWHFCVPSPNDVLHPGCQWIFDGMKTMFVTSCGLSCNTNNFNSKIWSLPTSNYHM